MPTDAKHGSVINVSLDVKNPQRSETQCGHYKAEQADNGDHVMRDS